MTCQICDAPTELVLSLGYMPPVNDYVPAGSIPREQTWLPTNLHYCPKCELVQLGYVADPKVVFPPSYPYTSGSTKYLRDNFADLAREVYSMGLASGDDMVVDIGSNDGTLLSNFKGRRTIGVEPTDVADIANGRGIKTMKGYFDRIVVDKILRHHGSAAVVTCANCFAHMPKVHQVVENVLALMKPDGVFVTESHYLVGLIESLQYDTIYHEHLRYYSLASLRHLLEAHGLEIFHARPIPTHGGSIRIYASRRDQHMVRGLLKDEPTGDAMRRNLRKFAKDVQEARLRLLEEIYAAKRNGRVVGIGAPSRASTVISYCRLDASLIDYVCELPGSLKIGKYMPGTDIPVVDEATLFTEQPEHAVIFSWHIADEVVKNLRIKGYRGTFIMPCAPEGIHDQAA